MQINLLVVHICFKNNVFYAGDNLTVPEIDLRYVQTWPVLQH